ncbi:Thiamine-phosphate synthase, partial [Tetrabaena socialis]
MALSVRGTATARVHTPAHASSPPLVHPPGVPAAPASTCGWSRTCGKSSHRQARKARSPLRHASSGRLVCGATATSGLGLFPSGIQQARVQLPAVILQIEASQLVSDASAIDLIGQALQGGCNMVVLWDSASNASALYDAALRVQEVLRGRAALLLVDRTDIALAIGAQGVLLTDQGVPTVLARRMMSGGSALIGRLVVDERAAVAAAADGASLIVVTGPGGTAPSPAVLAASRANQISGSAIPLLLGVRAASAGGAALAAALEAEVDGVAFSLEA